MNKNTRWGKIPVAWRLVLRDVSTKCLFGKGERSLEKKAGVKEGDKQKEEERSFVHGSAS